MADRRTILGVQPAQPQAESRAETVERALEEDAAARAAVGDTGIDSPVADPSTRRGVGRRALTSIVGWGLAGVVVGVVAAVVLSFLPGPWETSSTSDVVGYAVVLGIGVGIVFAVIGTLTSVAEPEDGRVARDVEKRTGGDPDPPR